MTFNFILPNKSWVVNILIEMADADEILLAMDDLELQAMVSAGRSLEEIQLMQKQKVVYYLNHVSCAQINYS